jgi:hypothetical protein
MLSFLLRSQRLVLAFAALSAFYLAFSSPIFLSQAFLQYFFCEYPGAKGVNDSERRPIPDNSRSGQPGSRRTGQPVQPVRKVDPRCDRESCPGKSRQVNNLPRDVA